MSVKKIRLLACPHCRSTNLQQEQFIPVNFANPMEPFVKGANHDPDIWCNDCQGENPDVAVMQYSDLIYIDFYDGQSVVNDFDEIECSLLDLKEVLSSEEDREDARKMIEAIKILKAKYGWEEED